MPNANRRHLIPLTGAQEKERMQQWRASCLTNKHAGNVIEKVMEAALDDDHRHQATAWKLVVDRILPLQNFADGKDKASAPQISINISGLSPAPEKEIGEIIENNDGNIINEQ